MRRILWMVLLVLALPMAAFATSGQVDFTNSGGTLTGSSSGLSLTGSVLTVVNGVGGNFGTFAFSTGAVISGDKTLQMGATLAGGGSFVITGNGKGGFPNGVIFNGSFDGPVTWTLVTLANGTHNYTLSGTMTGKWYTGATVYGATIQITVNTGQGYFDGSTSISSGDTNIVVPEPGSLTLMGTGLVGLAGLLRRKFSV